MLRYTHAVTSAVVALPWTLLLGLLLPQADPDRIRDLIKLLSSDQATERGEAARKLQAIGPPALPLLTAATSDADKEIAERAKNVIAVIVVREKLSPRLLKTFPGVELRLASGTDKDWMDCFLEATEFVEGKGPRYPELTSPDLEPLVAPALRGATYSYDVLHRMMSYRLRPAPGETAKLMETPVRDPLISTMRTIWKKEDVPEVVTLLHHSYGSVRVHAVETLTDLGATDQVPQIALLLGDRSPLVCVRALSALGKLGGKDVARQVLPFLSGRSTQHIVFALDALQRIGGKDEVPSILPLLGSPAIEVRRAAAKCLGMLGDSNAGTKLLTLLDDPDPEVKMEAASSLCRLGMRQGAPLVVRSGTNRSVLNAIRKPVEWNACRDRVLQADLDDTTKGNASRMAALLGLRFEWVDSPLTKERAGEREVQLSFGGRRKVLEVLEESGLEFVLETGQLRVLSHPDAEKFWKDWWAEEESKK